MNSVTKHTTAEMLAALIKSIRSKLKEVIFVVEGDTDRVYLSFGLGLANRNFVVAHGKENLDRLYMKGKSGFLDPGVIFVRDRDFDNLITGCREKILRLVTSRYDIEMELLENRIFDRIVSSFAKIRLDSDEVDKIFFQIVHAASYIGALRKYSHSKKANLNFDSLKYPKFLDAASFKVDTEKLITYICAKSKKKYDLETIATLVNSYVDNEDRLDLVCSKEFLQLVGIAFSKLHKFCDSKDCSVVSLQRHFISAMAEKDIEGLSFYRQMAEHIPTCGYSWPGTSM